MATISKLLNLPTTLSIKLWPMLNRLMLKSRDVVMGRNICIPGRIYVIGKGKITIGDDFYFSSGNAVNPISSNFRGALYVEDGAKLTIGNHVGMSSTRIWASQAITIGDHVNIGGGTLITDTDAHSLDWEDRRHGRGEVPSVPIVIGDDVWIGAQCIILKGVTIGPRSIIGAGSVVTHSIPADSIAAGNPCKVLRKINSKD